MSSASERKRTVAIVLAFVSAAALLVASGGPQWLHTLPGSKQIDVGLRSYTTCIDAKCGSASNFEVIDYLNKMIEEMKAYNATQPAKNQIAVPRPPWGGFPVVGLITLIMSVLAALGLLWGAVLALQRKRPELPIMPTTIAVLGLALAIVNGCLFLATKPEMVIHYAPGVTSNLIDDMGVGWTFWTFGIGAVLGLASVFPLNRQIRPIDEELGAASATMSWGTSRDEE